jgi:hypothetical protein
MTETFWIASYPRSGSTLVRLVLQRNLGVDTGALVREPDFNTPGTRALSRTMNGPTISGTKMHRMESREWGRPALVLVRDGRDAMVSFAHYMRTLYGTKAPFEELVHHTIVGGFAAARPWSDFYRYWNTPVGYGPRVMIRFEDVLEDPIGVVAAAVVGLLGEELQPRGKFPPFEHWHKDHPKFFRRGKVGAWRDEMPKTLADLFWEHHGEVMTALGYER